MTPEVKAAWVAALRSGEYTQGYGRLKTGESTFCCLGILCEIMGFEPKLGYRGGYSYPVGKQVKPGGLRDEVQSVPDPEVIGLDREAMRHLLILNDGQKFSFLKIADWVEENIKPRA